MGALSILLIAAGAILAFAVNAAVMADLQTIGVILTVVGAVGLFASMIRGSFFGFSRTRETAVSSDGRDVVERERVWRF